MKKRIGGWWRLWIALSAMYGLIVLLVVVADWPKDWINRKLSSEELQSLTEESRGLIANVLPYSVPSPDDTFDDLEANYQATIKAQDAPSKKQQKNPVSKPPWESAPREHRDTLAQPQKKMPSKWQDDGYIYLPPLSKSRPLQNGEYLIFKKSPTNAQVDLVKNDYARLQKASLWKERRSNLLKALLAWVLPCAFFLGLGLTIRWVFRGFRNKPPGQLPTPMSDTQP